MCRKVQGKLPLPRPGGLEHNGTLYAAISIIVLFFLAERMFRVLLQFLTDGGPLGQNFRLFKAPLSAWQLGPVSFSSPRRTS